MLVLFTAWSVWHIMDNGKVFPAPISKFIISFASFPGHVYHTLVPTSTAYNIFDPRQLTDTTSKDGVNLISNESGLSSTRLLISTFESRNRFEIKLLNIPDGKMIKKWNLNDNIIKRTNFIEQATLNFQHPLLTKDSSVIVIRNNGTLFSLNKFNRFNWVNKDYYFHHSLEQENDSTIWVCATVKESKQYNIEGFVHEAICSIDPRNGKVKYIMSVADILIENGLKYLLEIGYENGGIHLNDIEPAPRSSKYWEKGDLLMSMRSRNSIMLYRPTTNKIIWIKTGPWLAQHDCDFVDGKTIMIFGNDVLWNKNSLLVNGHNDIYFYDFEKKEVIKPYTNLMKKIGIKTLSEGRCDILSNGDLFIDESNNGKLYIINKDSLKMIYTERYDKNHIKMFNWVRPILN